MLEELTLDYDIFLDKSTVIFGESGSGKSTVINNIMYNLRPHIDQVLVISSSDKKNKNYSRKIVPKPCVHETVTDTLLTNVWKRQEALGNIYVRANNPTVISGLFNKIADNSARTLIGEIQRRKVAYAGEIKQNSGKDMDKKLSELDKNTKEIIMKIYKHYIGKNLSMLSRSALTHDEKISIKYLNLNPRLLWIFDDCTSELAKLKNHKIFQELFYQGRWSFITLIIAAHTDKVLPPEIKQNAFSIIFAQEGIARGYLQRDSTALDKASKLRALEAVNCAFTPSKEHQKLIWIRSNHKYYKFTAELHNDDFTFGSHIIREFCRLIQSDDDYIQDNAFMDKFDVEL